MVVKNPAPEDSGLIPSGLDLGYLALFVGLRINELVVRRLASAGFSNVRQSHGYVVQHLIERERTITELARRMEVTQQAASKTVGEMIGLGILEAVPAADRRAKRIRLSERGRKSVMVSRQERLRIEARLRRRIGRPRYVQTKAALLDCLAELGGLPRIQSRKVREPR